MTAFYNEIEKYPAAWMRNLIDAKHIAGGTVEERSIVDLTPRDVDGFTQAHFFAGIGLWSLALRMAGWPDDLPVWTGSCPCQPFSAAGKRKGKDDERHLWPSWYSLIKECRPPIIFGEQVASDDGLDWFDTVHSDLEGAGYAVGASDLCAAGVGAFNIRQRLYFVAMADANDWQRGQLRNLPSTHGEKIRSEIGDQNGTDQPGDAGSAGAMANTNGIAWEQGGTLVSGWDQRSYALPWSGPSRRGLLGRGFKWLACLDGKYRAVPLEPEFYPLAVRHPGDMGKLRAYGNAISPPVAATFVKALMECL